jgi:hypothetical protein
MFLEPIQPAEGQARRRLGEHFPAPIGDLDLDVAAAALRL